MLPAQRVELQEYVAEPFESLPRYVDLVDADDDDDFRSAQSIAALLGGVVHSSDIDRDYYPCTLAVDDPTSDAFFAALDVARDARASVSGWDNPKLEVVRAGDGPDERSAIALLSRLGDFELTKLDEYITETDLAAMRRALEALGAVGPIVGVQLCTDDGASKVVLTLAKRRPGMHVGVMTVLVET
jgi:hypothetical protein